MINHRRVRGPVSSSLAASSWVLLTAATLAWMAGSAFVGGADLSLPGSDQRAGPPKTLNTPREFPTIVSRAQWEQRAKDIRERILVSNGLWPLPERPDLKAVVFDKLDRDGYTVEKVHIQTFPGFYLAGNLYRPRGQGSGPFPGVLNPHGHWNEGRFADTEAGSIAARCIQFARLGMVAFSIDMVGYGDTHQAGPHRQFAADPSNLLWNISLMGLQTWNTIRGLDFLESLPDVDGARLACTGASGGGTQTFILGAIDDRVAALAPMVMVSHSMQGGCLCENAPGLRVDYSNMEIAAAAAPKPQLLVAATGDWTKTTPTIEGPAIQSVYQLFDQPGQLRFVRFDAPHNYNRATREEAYRWFSRWLLGRQDTDSIREQPFQVEPVDNLRVWPDGKAPEDALDASQIIAHWKDHTLARLEAMAPADAAAMPEFKDTLTPLWRHGLQLEFPPRQLISESDADSVIEGVRHAALSIGRAGKGDRIPALLLEPAAGTRGPLVVLAHPKGRAGFLGENGRPAGVAKQLLERGRSVLLADLFQTGALFDEAAAKARSPLTGFFDTYNRTDLQERVQDLVTLCTFARTQSPARRVVLCGQGRAGLWVLLAAPAADAVAADADGLDPTDDRMLLEPDLFSPGLRAWGAFDGGAALAVPHPLLIHNRAAALKTPLLQAAYAAAGEAKRFTSSTPAWDDAAVADWVARVP